MVYRDDSMIPKFLKDYKPDMSGEYCVICGKEIKSKKPSWIGINMETGKYTYDENLATQGWFHIGKDCEKKLDKDKILV